MVAEINAAIQSVRALSDLLKAGYSVRNANEVAAAVADVHAKLMPFLSAAVEAKEKELALHKRIGELEQENMELKDWKREAERYQLTEVAPSMFAYRLKPGMEGNEPPHYLCANCFTQNKKAILQRDAPGGLKRDTYRCQRCEKSLPLPSGRRLKCTADDEDRENY